MIKIHVLNFWISTALTSWFIHLHLITNKVAERYIVYNRSFFIPANSYAFCGSHMQNVIITCYNCSPAFFFCSVKSASPCTTISLTLTVTWSTPITVSHVNVTTTPAAVSTMPALTYFLMTMTLGVGECVRTVRTLLLVSSVRPAFPCTSDQ